MEENFVNSTCGGVGLEINIRRDEAFLIQNLMFCKLYYSENDTL